MMVEPTCIGFWPEDAGGNVAPDFGAQLVAILVVYRRRAHGHGLVAPVTFNTGISQGSRSSSFVRPASRSERLPKNHPRYRTGGDGRHVGVAGIHNGADPGLIRRRHQPALAPLRLDRDSVASRLQGNFLSKHHIACGQTAIRHKTPTHLGMSRIVHLLHVHTRTMVDSVSLSPVATHDIEVAFSIELRTLLR